MAFYSGSFSSMSNLQSTILTNLGTEGYSISGTTVTLPSAGVITFTNATNYLMLRAGDSGAGGAAGAAGTLVNPTPYYQMMSMQLSGDTVSFPGYYMMFCFSAPREVYIVCRVNTDYYMWCAFGVSDMPGLTGNGMWVAARNGSVFSTGLGINITGDPGSVVNSSPLFAWSGVGTGATYASFYMRDGFESRIWSTPVEARASVFTAPLMNIAYQPNAWNTESVLVPITVYANRASSLFSAVLQARNARYMRINNYAPESIITLGSDKWMVLPAYRKNASVNSDATTVSSAPYHTGTWGWALRYTGP